MFERVGTRRRSGALDDAVVANALLRRRVELLKSMAAVPTSDTVTDGVRVVVHSALVPEMSSPRDGTFVYSYKVAITNESAEEPVQVVSRHWEITDEDGHVEEVRGTGLVGFQPVLEMGKAFEYTSQAPLRRLRGDAASHRRRAEGKSWWNSASARSRSRRRPRRITPRGRRRNPRGRKEGGSTGRRGRRGGGGDRG